MIEVKGSVVKDAIKAVKARGGDQTYNAILNLLAGETRAFFERASISSSDWYSLDAFVQFLEKDLAVTAHGDEQVLVERAEALIEQQLRGMYRMFVEWGKPKFMLERIGIIHQTYYRGVTIDTSLPSAGQAIIKYTGFAKPHRLIGLTLIGFYRKALELSGAKAIKAEYTTSIEDDKGYCELLLSWKE